MTNKEYAMCFVHPDDRLRCFQVVKQNATRRKAEFVAVFKHRIICRNGEVRHILTRIRVIQDGSNYPARVYDANQDITERKPDEEERERLISELREALSQVKTLK